METATVTSKSMITIPSKIRKRYRIKEGMKMEFIELDEGVLMMPIRSLRELRGIDKDRADLLRQAIRELDKEHRMEVKE